MTTLLHHGTSARYLDQILKMGVHPCSAGDRDGPPVSCWTTEVAVAEWHARFMAECEDADPIVLSAPLTRFDPAHLIVDEVVVRSGPSGGDARGLGRYVFDLCGGEWDALPWSPRAMLLLTGHAAYTAPLPVTASDLRRL